MHSKKKHTKKRYSLHCLIAWIKEDEEEACNFIKIAIYNKRGWGEQDNGAYNKKNNAIYYENREAYIKFIGKFGPAMTGVSFWNNNKTNMALSELLTVTDEAFIHLCMINYAPTWKAQEKQKSGETNIRVPVSEIHCEMTILLQTKC
jgi:hypothetical protein